MQITQSDSTRKPAQIGHGDIEDFIECCADQAWYYAEGWISLQTAVDNLQHLAELWNLPEQYGQNFVQHVIAYEQPKQEMPSRYEIDYVQRIIKQWEIADTRKPHAPPPRHDHYRTPQSTIDAFFCVTREGDADRLATWLAEHSRDVLFLTRIWERKCSTIAA